jgi:hypothetical protein
VYGVSGLRGGDGMRVVVELVAVGAAWLGVSSNWWLGAWERVEMIACIPTRNSKFKSEMSNAKHQNHHSTPLPVRLRF